MIGLTSWILVCGLVIGCHASSSVEDFLVKYGYLSSSKFTIPDISSAVRQFQRFSDLPVTGIPDIATFAAMKAPRCGNHDSGASTYAKRKWNKSLLTYKFVKMTRHLPDDLVKEIIKAAFKVWSDVTPLKFEERSEKVSTDLTIGFYRGGHGDGFQFDGKGGTLAHAFLPRDGDIHFDDSEIWVDGPSQGDAINFFVVAAHEIGHSIGLQHVSDKTALMYPYHIDILDRLNYKLPSIDRENIQKIYGDGSGTGSGSGSGHGTGSGSGVGSGTGSGTTSGNVCKDELSGSQCARISLFKCLSSQHYRRVCRKTCGTCS